MTRYARGNKGNRKRPHEAVSWDELQDQSNNCNQRRRTKDDKDDTSKRKQDISDKSKRRKRKEKHKHKDDSVKDERGQDSSIIKKTPENVQDVSKQEDSGSEEEEKRTLGADGKKERRREDRRLKRIKNKASKMVCYHCREAGHGVADCPKMLRDEEQGTGICFCCGSTEHEANKCTAKVDPTKGDFPFAKCFICQEAGHLSRSCPDNPRGLYPLGGGCKHCGSVEHRNQHCSHSTDEQKHTEDTTLPTLSSTLSWSADAEIDDIKPIPVTVRQTTKKTPKVVTF